MPVLLVQKYITYEKLSWILLAAALCLRGLFGASLAEITLGALAATATAPAPR